MHGRKFILLRATEKFAFETVHVKIENLRSWKIPDFYSLVWAVEKLSDVRPL